MTDAFVSSNDEHRVPDVDRHDDEEKGRLIM
jgi:hypothetical protein